MKKIVIIFFICMTTCFLNIGNLNALQLHNTNFSEKYKTIKPRAMETYTITHDMGLGSGDGGYITWKATITYDPSQSRMILSNMTVTTHFSYMTPTWSLSSFSCKPDIGANVLHDDYVVISYKIHTVGSVYINGDFNFQLY